MDMQSLLCMTPGVAIHVDSKMNDTPPPLPVVVQYLSPSGNHLFGDLEIFPEERL